MTDSFGAVLPPRGSQLGVASWLKDLRSLAASTLQPPPFATEDVPRGKGEVVLTIPGFLAGDWTMIRLRNFLSNLGYRVETPGIEFNAGPTAQIIACLDAALLRLAEESGGPIALIGQSLGGVLARELAHRHPQAVRQVITLCSPIRFPISTPLAPFAQLLAPFHDPVWLARAAAIVGQPPAAPVTAIYSPDDGIVDWRQCLQDEAPGYANVAVAGAHSTMGSNPAAQAAIARALASRGV
jgi:pimeloyl-ACP methyl ester carboxylesterase